ncbi:unnamed protein product [Candida dubliniensis CD36]|uniref:SnoaL-like domain-containing protein n=1 Tax=Candida dubliniensis (strain CD36 / ATCC MYA-646 / CBS 7987 / NCPF 3949 / NRRL Y-17841) TaxID=573826 RepID=B9WFS0_CANDC|nr:uncharacterized protein CD36_42090 [Candida dubliniensis CD36]CAX42089.1 unnamed protein product [Candida dubliniensis CD36]
MTIYSPGIERNEKLKEFIVKFYRASDKAPPSDEQDPYLEFFAIDSPLVMGLKKVNGHEKIAQLRQGMWEKVTHRHHVVNNVAEINENEILLNGYVEYTLINGKNVTTEWAGHIKLANSPGSENGYKMNYYQVYLDPSAAAKALSE